MSASTVSLQAPDISCGHCVNAIQNRLSALPGVESVNASAETKEVEIIFDANTLTLDKIKTELEDEGYPATEI